MFFSFYTPKDFSFFTTIGILSHKVARRSTDQSAFASTILQPNDGAVP